MSQIMSPRLQRSQLLQNAGGDFELQDSEQYSLVTLPAAINPSGGVLFFGDTESAVGRARTNMTRAGEIPEKNAFEIFGVGLKFLPPFTVLWTSVLDAMRDAYITLVVNQSERGSWHMSRWFPSVALTPSEAAAANDVPVNTAVGRDFYKPMDPSIVLWGGVNFQLRVFFTTNVPALANTVLGVYFNGLMARGGVKLDVPQSSTATGGSGGVIAAPAPLAPGTNLSASQVGQAGSYMGQAGVFNGQRLAWNGRNWIVQ